MTTIQWDPPAGTVKSCKVSAVKFDRALIHRLRLTHKVLPASAQTSAAPYCDLSP